MCEDEMVQSPSDGDSPAPGTRELGQRARREAPRLSRLSAAPLPPRWAGPALTQARSFEVHGWKGKREETHTLG